MVVVALDTGGTKIAGAAVDENGNILHQLRYPNSGRTGEFILDTYAQIVKEMQGRYPVAAIGIGTNGAIDPVEGKVLFAEEALYTGYIGLEIGKIMAERCGMPVSVDNDCRVAVYGERWMGCAKSYDDIFGIILGTGMGGGYILKGKSVLGALGGAGEAGHMILHPDGKSCSCGQKGCAEKYVSGTALWKAYNSTTGRDELSSGYEFFTLVSGGDKTANGILDNFVRDLAVCAVSIANLLSPQAILIGGGLADTADQWWERLEKAYRERGSLQCNKTVLLRAATGNNAALLGAAWLAFDKLKKKT